MTFANALLKHKTMSSTYYMDRFLFTCHCRRCIDSSRPITAHEELVSAIVGVAIEDHR